MIKSFMNEIKRDFINSENKSHIILNKTQPELVPCIEDTSIIEKRHLPQIIELTKKARKERRDLSFALSGNLQPDKQIFPVDLIPPTDIQKQFTSLMDFQNHGILMLILIT